jgi:two-component sensor histidine kinase
MNYLSKIIGFKISLLFIFVFWFVCTNGQSPVFSKEVKHKIDSLNHLLMIDPSDSNQFKINYNIGYTIKGINSDSAEFYFLKAYKIARESNARKKLPAIYNELGGLEINRNNYSQARVFLDSCKRISQEVNDSFMLASAYDNSGIIKIKQREFSAGIELRKKGLAIHLARKDSVNIANEYQWLGNTELLRERYAEALEFFLKSIQISEKIGEELNVAYAKAGCASIYRRQGKLEYALKANEECLVIFKGNNELQSAATIQNNIGNIYMDLGKDSLAEIAYLNALEMYIKLKDSSGICVSKMSIGLILQNRGHFFEARQCYQIALSIAQNLKKRYLEGVIFVNMGENELTNNNLKSAKYYLSQSLQIGIELKNKAIKSSAYNLLSSVFEKQGKYKKALEYYKKYKVENDSIFEETKGKTILELEASYDSEKKGREIAELTKAKVEQEQKLLIAELDKKTSEQNLFLFKVVAACFVFLIIILVLANGSQKRSNHQIEILLKDLKHTTIINTLPNYANQIAKLISTSLPPKISVELTNLAYQIRALSGLYEILYEDNNVGGKKLDMETFLNDLISKQQDAWPKANQLLVKTEVESLYFPFSTARTCGLILNEFITNSFKHALIENVQPEIEIKLYMEENGATFFLKDNGPGFPLSFLNHIDSESQSQGHSLIKNHASSIKAEARFFNHENGGAACEILNIRIRR